MPLLFRCCPVRFVNGRKTDAGARVDLFRQNGPDGRPVAVDVSIVDIAPQLTKAINRPGGAATAHEAFKRTRYEHLADRAGYDLVPVVVETFGAFGESALPLLKRMAKLWGNRIDMHPSRAIPVALCRISVAMARSVARLALAHATPLTSF